MNNFVYHKDPCYSANQYCDQHQGKLRLEFAQMLSTAIDLVSNGTITPPYKKTHANHPSAKWVRATKENFQWSLECLRQLNTNWLNNGHNGELIAGVITEIDSVFPRLSFVDNNLTTPYLAMPNFIKAKWADYNQALGVWIPRSWDHCIEAYREYTNLKTFATNPITKLGVVKAVTKLGLRPKYTINTKPSWYKPLHQVSVALDSQKRIWTDDYLATQIGNDVLFWDVQEPKELTIKVFGKKTQIPYKVWLSEPQSYVSGYTHYKG